MHVHQVGLWGSSEWLKNHRREDLLALSVRAEDLGLGSIWISAGFEQGIPAAFGDVLTATSQITVASGILSIWHASPADVTRFNAALEAGARHRMLWGLGASHAPQVEALGLRYEKPYSAMTSYLDAADALADPLPVESRMLAALGPRMLALARDRSRGAHPYLVPVEHTSAARAILGDDALLIPEQTVAMIRDSSTARRWARSFMARYLALPNYATNLIRLGYSEEDLLDGGSDRLVDDLVAWGSASDIVQRIGDHLEAGANAVCLRFIDDGPDPMPGEELDEIVELIESRT